MRWVKGLAAAVGLVVGLAGVPAALLVLGGNPWPAALDWTSIQDALLTPDDGRILLGVITVVGWLAWLVFLVSVVLEAVALGSRQRIRIRLPGLAAPQRLAAGLLVSLITLISLPHLSSVPGPSDLTPVASTAGPGSTNHDQPGRIAPTSRSVDAAATDQGIPPDGPTTNRTVTTAAPTGSSRPSGTVHRVRPGDDLWSLAQRYYGEGRDWRRIATANPDVLTGGPDRLQPGWRLVIPGVSSARRAAKADETTVEVQAGDTLSRIAARELGSAHRWPEVYEANRSQVADPDLLAAGMVLRLPTRTASPASDVAPPRPERSTDPEAADPATPDSGGPDAAVPEGAAPGVTDPEVGDVEAVVPGTIAPPAAEPPDGGGPENDEAGAAGSGAEPLIPNPVAPVPGTPVPSTSDSVGSPDPSAVDRIEEQSEQSLPLAGIGGLLAAGLVAGLAMRRRSQLQVRPVGRRILAPPAAAQRVEVAVGRRQRPVTLRTLDLASRAIAAHCRTTGEPLPPLLYALVGDHDIELVLRHRRPQAPVGFVVRGRSWILHQSDAGYLNGIPGLSDSGRPWPALVTIGRDGLGRLLVADLESLGVLCLAGAAGDDREAAADQEDKAAGVLAAMAVELSFSPWAEEMALTVVGDAPDLPAALGRHHLTRTQDLGAALDRLERRGAEQRASLSATAADGPGQSEAPVDSAAGVVSSRPGLERPELEIGHRRIDPDLADPWAPEIVLVDRPLSALERSRLESVVLSEPRVALAAVIIGDRKASPWVLTIDSIERDRGPIQADSSGRGSNGQDSDGRDAIDAGPTGILEPVSVPLRLQCLDRLAAADVQDLVLATGSDETTPAPWWAATDAPPPGPPQPPDPLGAPADSPSIPSSPAWGSQPIEQREEGLVRTTATDTDHPTLLLLGPIELEGAAGAPPPRAEKQCLEYCGWLLEHPGTTAQAMANALVVAEGTRRSNMSRLRGWLGSDPLDQPYLPDAYSGRIHLHSAVRSDWLQLQVLTFGGVNRASSESLEAALHLLRGAPLADAAPGQWPWAEELRTDMISCLRDIGVELTERAIVSGDLDLARWAAARALVAAPGDELLMAMRIRTEHRAGNAAETERLTLQLAAQARALGVDLDLETVALLQEVMEGRVRARMV